MMVIADDPERAVWIDFDRAETYDADQLTTNQEALLEEEEEEEEEIVVGFRECLVSAPAADSYLQGSDYAEGKLEKAYLFYCT